METRPALREDAELVFGLVRELAAYEKLSEAVKGDAQLLATTLFDDGNAEALIAEVDEEPVGYAIFFTTYSSFECRPGLWIEDLFVRPERRRGGAGSALLSHIARIARDRDCARIEWSALDWNEPALRFYDQAGATLMKQWRILRLDGEALTALGSS